MNENSHLKFPNFWRMGVHFEDLIPLEEETARKLDKVILTPQTVAGPVEFFESITVPTGSLILGTDGARLSSGARVLTFTDARERFNLINQYEINDTGSSQSYQWKTDGLLSNADVCPDAGQVINPPMELAFSGATGNTLTTAFWIIPAEAGMLKIQSWEGTDDTGAVLGDNTFEVTAPMVGVSTRIVLNAPPVSEIGDMQFVRFSGIDLEGAVQSSGLFVGELCPFLQSDVHLLMKEDLVNQDTEYLDFAETIPDPPHKPGRMWFDGVNFNLFDNIADTSLQIGKEIVIDGYNNNGVTLMNFTVVRQDGATGGTVNIVRAQADTVANAQSMGVCTHDITVGSVGKITTQGSAGGDASAWNTGDLLFLSATTPGQLTNIEQPILKPVARVLVGDTEENGGAIYIFQRSILNITAIAQVSKDTGSPTQIINTTAEPISAYSNTSLPQINVTPTFTLSEGNYECKFSPASIGASGYYRVDFSAHCEYGGGKNVTFTVYINGSPTTLSGAMPFAGINPSNVASLSFSGITPTVISSTDEIEIYVEVETNSGTLTFVSCLFSITRIGNA